MVFIPNRDFLKSDTARDACAAKGADIIDLAEADAPRRTGHLAGSLTGEWLELEDGRFVWRVIATDFKAGWLEFGTIHQPAHHFLARAAVAVVGHLE